MAVYKYVIKNYICIHRYNKHNYTFFKTYLFCLFIFVCIRSSLLRVGFLYLQRAGATLHCGARASHCGGFSCCGAWALGARVSVVVARRL